MKKQKKKRMAATFAVFTALSLMACGTGRKEFYGTWNAVSGEAEGKEFTIEELEEMGDYSMSNISIIVNEDGKAYIHDGQNQELVDWEKTKEGIKIGEIGCVLHEEVMTLENNGVKVNLEKTSESQTIPDDSE